MPADGSHAGSGGPARRTPADRRACSRRGAQNRLARLQKYAPRADSFPAGNRARQGASSRSAGRTFVPGCRRAYLPARSTSHGRPPSALTPRAPPGGRMLYTGELAALGTAVCWASASNLFAGAAGRMGSRILNRLRITAAWGFLSVTLWLVHHALWPTWASAPATLALALSGMIGFIFGDSFGFRAIVILGPGRASLLASTAPLFTTALAWPLLHQHPGPMALLGMVLTLSGTAFVFTAPSRRRHGHAEGGIAMGIASGLLGALGQAG